MTCPRCEGLMVGDLSCDLAETQGMWVSTTRCMNCGHVTDPTIEKNRMQTNRPAGVGQTMPERAHTQNIISRQLHRLAHGCEAPYQSGTSSAS